MADPPPSTPCIKVCAVSIGCGRTLAEIASWGSLTELERRAIMAALPDRLAKVEAP